MTQANWKNLTDPDSLDFTNSIVNFYDGALIRQMARMETLTMPSGIQEGKRFVVANSHDSRNSISMEYSVGASEMNSLEIPPGDAFIFFSLGGNIWDIAGDGEEAEIEDVPASSIVETITSLGSPSIEIGTVPSGAAVVKVSVDVSAAFSGTNSNMSIASSNGGILMDGSENDLSKAGQYAVARSIANEANGAISATISPTDGTASGTVKIVVSYEKSPS